MRHTSKTMFLSRIVILLCIMLYVVISCNPKEEKLTVKNISPAEKEISFKVNKEFLLLPIQSDAPLKKIKIYSDNNIVRETELPLAVKKLDYMLPVDLNYLKRDSDVRIIVSDSLQTSVWVDSLKLTNTMDLGYADKYRQVYHFTAPYGWFSKNMGSFYINGEYHMFYQYYPYGRIWGKTAIAHASGPNLFEWSYKKADFDIKDIENVNSGDVVIDTKDNSGFGNNSILYFYTLNNEKNCIKIKYSTTLGDSFKETDKKVSIEGMEDMQLNDPRVIRYEKGNKWIMLVSSGSKIFFLSSENLLDWKKESFIDFNTRFPDTPILNPNLVELSTSKGEKQWVLLYNIKNDLIKEGLTKYIVGNFDGSSFNGNINKSFEVDYGMDYTTPSVIRNSDTSEDYLFSWMDNYLYAGVTPNIIYTNCKTLPRKLSLIKYGSDFYLNTAPSSEYNKIAKMKNVVGDVNIDKDFSNRDILKDMKGTCKISFKIKPEVNTVGVVLSNKLNEFVSFSMNFANNLVSLDRHKSGITNFSKDFPGKIIAPISSELISLKKGEKISAQEYQVDIYLDKSSIEIFINNGEITISNIIFPTEPYHNISFSRLGGNAFIYDLEVTGFEYNATLMSLGWLEWVEGTAGD